ncbi:MAG: hypothetical protein P8172_17110 [Gammaproteobacteria bacterium]
MRAAKRRVTDIATAAALGLALAATGCTSLPEAAEYRASTALLEPASGGPAGADGRARFREVFCAVAAAQDRVPPDDPSCDRLLWRLADEPAPALPFPAAPALDPDLRVFVVGGAFSDCFGEASVAFGSALSALRAAGHHAISVPISSRSSAGLNADRIADTLVAAELDTTDRVVLVGYSKGGVDILRFLADFPSLASAVDAVVNVSCPVRGSRVADRGSWLYDTLLSGAFAARCDPGDGGVVDSLRTEVRQAWLAEHAVPSHVRFYTLSAFTTREHMARGLVSSWRALAADGWRNDGQVTLEEGLLPGSTLLGYANTDHWGLAIDIEDELEFFAARPDDRAYPRRVLFEAILRYVSDDLSAASLPVGSAAP